MDWYIFTDKGLIAKIGEKLRQIRLEQNITQKELAERAGVSLSSVASVEKGNSVSLSTLIAILRALHALHLLDAFFHEPEISPIAYAQMMDGKKMRQRASGSKKITI
ncbi:MAG TPA: helix-turn-helix transcriptional regulator [Bacteroidales bacterium]|jgi:transcriptional regulator with XRE-family HTH domain|nr:helix-turn-helix transcriptional regulator [Bacteroidales bacterium]